MPPMPEKRSSGIHLPQWMSDLAMKLLPWAIMGLTGGVAGLIIDNVNTKSDLKHEKWRNDQQDGRAERLEARDDRIEAAIAHMQNNAGEFHQEVIERLKEILQRDHQRGKR